MAHATQRAAASGAPRLAVARFDDPAEREADRMAAQVTDGPAKPDAAPRGGGSAGAGGIDAPASLHQTVRSGGRPLDSATRGWFERRFSHDFSDVRLHTDQHAAESSLALGASAYTVGRDIAFAPGRFAPDSSAGRALLAHELAHVVQQDDGTERVQRAPFSPSNAEAVIVRETKTTHEVRESVHTYCYEILRNAGLDPDAWYANFTSINFLGIAVPNIHQELADHLRAKETAYLAQYGNADNARKSLGLIDMTWGGARDYPTSAAISMHLFGLAVDVNYDESPFISSESANPVLKRAGIMFDGKPREYHDGMNYDQLDTLNSILEDYFHYLDWNDLRGRLAELGEKAPAEFRGKNQEQVEKLIQQDLDQLGAKWQRQGAKNKIRDYGFLGVRKDFVDSIGLAWGGSYGDIMHFDMRNASASGQHGAAIQGAIQAYVAKKKAEAKKVEADDGHGG